MFQKKKQPWSAGSLNMVIISKAFHFCKEKKFAEVQASVLLLTEHLLCPQAVANSFKSHEGGILTPLDR